MEGGVASLFSQGKFRGPDFEPIPFKFEPLGSPDVLDAKGRQVPIPVCVPIAPEAIETKAAERGHRDMAIIRALVDHPRAPIRDLCMLVGVKSTSTMSDALARLARRGFVNQGVDLKYRLTAKGNGEVDVADPAEKGEASVAVRAKKRTQGTGRTSVRRRTSQSNRNGEGRDDAVVRGEQEMTNKP